MSIIQSRLALVDSAHVGPCAVDEMIGTIQEVDEVVPSEQVF